MQVTELPIVPGDWVVEAETGAGVTEEKGVTPPSHITQAESVASS